jgi:thiamine biosynthesis lipoprotein
VPAPEELAEARARSGSRLIRLDPDHRTVAFDRPGVVLNFGSIGKGYALDRVAEVIKGYWFPTGALVHGGQSSLYAIGSPPDRFGGRWQIRVTNPFDPGSPVGTVHLRDRGLATSGGSIQRFEVGGRCYSHLIDPRTGAPVGEGAPGSVTVLAPTAAEADALATAFSILGPEASADFLRDRPDVGALFVLEGEGGVARLVTSNLTDRDFTPDALEGESGSS